MNFIQKKTNLFLEVVLKKADLVKLLKLFLFIFCFFFFNEKIIEFSEIFLFVKPGFSNLYLDILLLVFCIGISLKIGFKILKDKYIPSFSQFFIAFSTTFILLYFYSIRMNLNWNFQVCKIIDREYIWFILLPMIIFILLNIFIFFADFIKLPKLIDENDNQFRSDGPIKNSVNDKLDYDFRAEKLYRYLKSENFKSSFSIGLIGAWGNGKSSFVHLLNNKLKTNYNALQRIKRVLKKTENQNIITIHFLPYLNHNDDDIINEFFTSLSKELSKINGKLSDQILDYSQKLTNLYKEQNILGVFERHVKNFNGTPAKTMYDEINQRLIEINKKIIVFVDDLDRLNENEILQVLKLIRNTADFQNTIFIVAMDKNYVIDRLKTNNAILDTKFIDKFFQLEIYLPEIDKAVLKSFFIEEIRKSSLSGSGIIVEDIISALNDSNNMFNDYISNFRDVKRFVNQLIYDYAQLNEIDVKDFMNFTYFKLKFPKFIKLLNEKRDEILIVNEIGGLQIYSLVLVDAPKKNSFDTIFIGNEIDLTKYKIYKNEVLSNVFDEYANQMQLEDRALLIKTIVYLFGEDNVVKNSDSIRYMHNFNMLMEQKVFENFLTLNQFTKLLDIDKADLELKNLSEEGKLSQLIDRLKYFQTEDIDKLNKVVNIVGFLFEKRREYGLVYSELLELLSRFVQQRIDIDVDDNFSTWLCQILLDNNELSEETRLYLISHLLHLKKYKEYWKNSVEDINIKIKKLYQKYLDRFNNNLWEVTDYSFYGMFHTLKNFKGIRNAIDKAFIEFWKRNKIALLCAQIIDMDPFSKVLFRLSDIAEEIFGSKSGFIEFVKTHKDSKTPEIKEYLKFYLLCEIVRFSDYIVYDFKVSQLMIDKIKNVLANKENDYDGLDGSAQVFFETNSQDLASKVFQETYLSKKYSVKNREYEGKYYIILYRLGKLTGNDVVDFSQQIYDIAIKNGWKGAMFEKGNITKYENFISVKNNIEYVKLISIQP